MIAVALPAIRHPAPAGFWPAGAARAGLYAGPPPAPWRAGP
ncbi:hypothetical protein [Nonomuraea fuscirosea]